MHGRCFFRGAELLAAAPGLRLAATALLRFPVGDEGEAIPPGERFSFSTESIGIAYAGTNGVTWAAPEHCYPPEAAEFVWDEEYEAEREDGTPCRFVGDAQTLTRFLDLIQDGLGYDALERSRHD